MTVKDNETLSSGHGTDMPSETGHMTTAEDCLDLISGRSASEVAVIRRACHVAERAHTGQVRASGEPYVQHALAVARILADLDLDHETITAAVLHDVVEDTAMSLAEIREEFGDGIASLVEGVTKMDVIEDVPGQTVASNKERARAENLRNMLLAMARDVRVVLIKLADRLHNMRTLSHLSLEKQKRIAQETLEIYAPLANRLGIWQIKWELEDLAFKHLDPRNYKRIAQMLTEKRSQREQYIEDFIRKLAAELRKIGIDAQLTGRAKHIYSIWWKMKRKDLDFHHVFDTRAVRILVNSVPECYAALGVVHTLWRYIPGEFDDYIATPKENKYRSIHTAILGPEGKTVEVQIRTNTMHEHAELGVASHWRYKETKQGDPRLDEKIAWLRQLLEWKDEIADASDFVEQFKSEMFEDRVYVFAPDGNIVDLPSGATPVDFAYHIHTEVGHRCRGAKVNGRIVPLTYKLKIGEKVEILTVKSATPSRDWLNPHLGYLGTPRARNKVRAWFRKQDFDQNVADGKAMLEREFKRLGVNDANLEQLARRKKYNKTDELLASIGRGDLKISQVIATIQERSSDVAKREESPRSEKRGERTAAQSIKIQGVGNLLTRMAACCKPVPGDPVIGYITRGRGVTIHRRDCANALRLQGQASERIVEVDWGNRLDAIYPVDIEVVAYDRPGLLRDVSAIVASENINVAAVQTLTDKRDQTARMKLTLEITDIQKLSRVLAKLNQLPNVADVRRRLP